MDRANPSVSSTPWETPVIAAHRLLSHCNQTWQVRAGEVAANVPPWTADIPAGWVARPMPCNSSLGVQRSLLQGPVRRLAAVLAPVLWVNAAALAATMTEFHRSQILRRNPCGPFLEIGMLESQSKVTRDRLEIASALQRDAAASRTRQKVKVRVSTQCVCVYHVSRPAQSLSTKPMAILADSELNQPNAQQDRPVFPGFRPCCADSADNTAGLPI